MNILNGRVKLEAPDWKWDRKPDTGLAFDEFGNGTAYLRTPVGGVVIWWDPFYQTDVELPEPGTDQWVDRRYYPESGK